MQRITQIEQQNGFTLPNSYKQLLDTFELFMVLEFKAKDMDIKNINLITEPIRKATLQSWQCIKLWVFEDDRIVDDKVRRHDVEGEFVDKKHLEHTFMFGSYGDGVRLYFDTTDMSVWQYWMDEGSVGKVADSFDEIIQNSEVIESE